MQSWAKKTVESAWASDSSREVTDLSEKFSFVDISVLFLTMSTTKTLQLAHWCCEHDCLFAHTILSTFIFGGTRIINDVLSARIFFSVGPNHPTILSPTASAVFHKGKGIKPSRGLLEMSRISFSFITQWIRNIRRLIDSSFSARTPTYVATTCNACWVYCRMNPTASFALCRFFESRASPFGNDNYNGEFEY